MEESLGLGKKSYGAETDTEIWSWFLLPIPKPVFGRTLVWTVESVPRLFLLGSLQDSEWCTKLEASWCCSALHQALSK